MSFMRAENLPTNFGIGHKCTAAICKVQKRGIKDALLDYF